MTASVLVDTDILIDASRKLTTAVDFLDALEREGSVGISLITKLELMSVCRNKRELRTTERFFRRFVVISLVIEADGPRVPFGTVGQYGFGVSTIWVVGIAVKR